MTLMRSMFEYSYMQDGDCGRTTQKGYVEILEFTHFVELFSFNRIAENHKEKELVRKVTVVVALDLGCGNTKNSEYESISKNLYSCFDRLSDIVLYLT